MKRWALLSTMLLVSVALAGQSQQEQLTNTLSELVSMPTVTSDKMANEKALDWVEQKLAPYGLHVHRQSFNGHPTLVATTKKTKEPGLFLVSHIDVVPAPEVLFNPRIEGERMLGRGVYDMKMAIACYLLLLEETKEMLPELNLGIMLTSDEEVGGMNGTKRLLEEGYSSKVAFLPDGGFDWNFEEEAKGVLHIKVTAKGKSAHGSRPHEGENAIERLQEALIQIKAYMQEKKLEDEHYHTTGNLGVIRGGEAVNQVPEFAEAFIDIRYTASQSEKKLLREIQKLIEDNPDLSVEMVARGSAHYVDVGLPPFVRFAEIAKEKFGIEIGVSRSHGASDARFFSDHDIPVLVIAPKGGQIHSDDEWINLKDLTRFYRVLKAWAIETSRQA